MGVADCFPQYRLAPWATKMQGIIEPCSRLQCVQKLPVPLLDLPRPLVPQRSYVQKNTFDADDKHTFFTAINDLKYDSNNIVKHIRMQHLLDALHFHIQHARILRHSSQTHSTVLIAGVGRSSFCMHFFKNMKSWQYTGSSIILPAKWPEPTKNS